ncbi:MAG: Eco57I restriction-modification methylase domain-containing protein [Candidatus Hodarchaeales archaeon]|jgi:methylase of polypeptide subunit release factors
MENKPSVAKLGAVPTPSKIVQFIINVILSYWKDIRKTVPVIERLNVLDPAVGDGRFLITFASCFEELAKKKNLKTKLHCYGLDIDPKAIESAYENISEINTQKSPEISLKVGNALLGYVSAPRRWKKTWSNYKLNNLFASDHNIEDRDVQKVRLPFHWFQEWPEVVANGGFDILIGNPPYGINFLREEKLIFRNLYQAVDPEIESYILFIERSIQLLREGGLLGLLIPSNLSSNYRYHKIRQYLLDNAKILRIINLDNKIFPGFHVETCILTLQHLILQREQQNHKIQYENIKTTLNDQFHSFKRQVIIQNHILKNPYRLFLPKPEAEILSILEKIQNNSISLKKLVSISRGIELGFHSPHTSECKLNSDFVPLIAGRSIRKFRITNNIRYIRFNKKNKSIFKEINLYMQPKLLLRRIGHELIAVFDPNKHFCVCDVYMIILNPNRPASELVYLEALLNSNLMSFYLMQRFTSVKQIFPKIPIKYLKDLPIKIPSSIVKIQQLVKDLHKLPWNIHQANSHQVQLLRDLNQEIFRIYTIDKHKQNIIQKLFKNFTSGL